MKSGCHWKKSTSAGVSNVSEWPWERLLLIKPSQQERLKKANELIKFIAQHGRKFFSYKEDVAYLAFRRNRIWYFEPYNKEWVFTHYKGRWRKFIHGGTLKGLIYCLRGYIINGQKLHPKTFGPWPKSFCNGDLWAYGEDMPKVKAKAVELGIIDE
jgi:hypothetical protein